jgi:hypothetical protein
MARRVFFSFHYVPDVQRAQVVRNSWVTKQDREDAGFFDASVFEATKLRGDDKLKAFLDQGLSGTSVTAVLFGSDTASRRWVRYELLRSFVQGKGILAIDVHSIPDFERRTTNRGPNPLEVLGFEIHGSLCRIKESGGNNWTWSADIAGVPVSQLGYNFRGETNATLSRLFRTYDWNVDNGYSQLGSWIQDAATAAGR